MRVFLAVGGRDSFIFPSILNSDIDDELKLHKPYILVSFYYMNRVLENTISLFGDFILDSGAFTFMSKNKGVVDWKSYLDKYIDFINRNNVDKFLELDIDSVIGYDNVIRIRKYIEDSTKKKCIPVWHKGRGKNDFLKMCDEYEYVAIGGIVSKEITKADYCYFDWFIREAHRRGCKIHGLGFTNCDCLRKYGFDSVDSSSWTFGQRVGKTYKFNGNKMVYHVKPNGFRMIDSNKIALNNYVEWLKYQIYMDEKF